MALTDDALAVRRVVAELPPATYVRLYAVKLKTRTSLKRLLIEAVELLIERHNQAEQGREQP